MNDEFSLYIEKRLNQWADWFSRNHCYGLGYPPHSMEYILMRGGSRANRGYSGVLPCNEEAEEIERLVSEMSGYNYNMAIAIRCHYFTTGGLRIKAKRVEISHMHYKNYVDMARQWLAGRLSLHIHEYQRMRS